MLRGLPVFIFLPVLLLTACTAKQEQKPDPMAEVDTLAVKPGGKLELQRYHTFVEKAPDIYGHLPRMFSFSDTGHYVYSIDSGSLVYTPKYFTALCFVHLQPDSSFPPEKIPGLLNTGTGPVQIEYKGNFYPGERPSATCYLRLNDTTVLLNNAENKIRINKNLIHDLETAAYVDGLKWPVFKTLIPGKSVKDSIRLGIRITFDEQKKNTATAH
jgi:hypothetical protein